MSASPAAARSPHVVFEVDLTTDIRDRKLDVYGPDNDPFLGAERSISRRAGWREGREEGRREGLVQERLSMIERLLAARKIRVDAGLNDVADRIAAMPHDAVLEAALECADLADLLRRLGLGRRTPASG